MRLNLMHGFAAAAIAVAVFGFVAWGSAPPALAELQWHEGELVSIEETVRRDRNTRRRLPLRIDGLPQTFRHGRGYPAYDRMLEGLGQGVQAPCSTIPGTMTRLSARGASGAARRPFSATRKWPSITPRTGGGVSSSASR